MMGRLVKIVYHFPLEWAKMKHLENMPTRFIIEKNEKYFIVQPIIYQLNST